MKNKTSLFAAGLLACLLIPCAHAQSEDRLEGGLTIGVRDGEETFEGFGDILAPLWSDESSLLFLSPRFSANNDDQEEFNLGLGYRYLMENRNAIWGANLYYDSRLTAYNNTFAQAGFGLEFLSRWLDARANYYLPKNETKLIASYTETTVNTVSRATFGDIEATQNILFQDILIDTTSTTTRRVFNQYESALEGFDAELGVKLPVPDRWLETRVFLGYQSFDNPFGSDYHGLKSRLEVRALPGLILDAEHFENSDLNETSYYVGLRFRMPFDLANLSQGRNPFEGAGDDFRRQQQHFESRMTEMVIRDLKIQMSRSAFTEDKLAKRVSEQQASETITETIMDDVTFVDADNTTGRENGTFEAPYMTVQEGVNNVFGLKNVYVQAASSDYRENVVLSSGTSLYGSGITIAGQGGKTYGGTAYPTIDGQNLGPSVTLAHGTTVRGARIVNTDFGNPAQNVTVDGNTFDISRAGVYANGATSVTIADSIIEHCGNGAVLLADGTTAFSPVVRNSVFQDNAGHGLAIAGLGAGGTFTPMISGSAFSRNAAGHGVFIYGDSYDTIQVSLRDSQAYQNGLDGFHVDVDGDSATALFSNLDAYDQLAGHGIFANIHARAVGGTASVLFEGVTSHDNAGQGIELEALNSHLGAADARFEDVVAYDNGLNGIHAHILAASSGGSGAATAAFVGGQIHDNGANGVDLNMRTEDGIASASFEGLTSAFNAVNGLDIWMESHTDMVRLFGERNILRGNIAGDGVNLDGWSIPGLYELDFGGGALGSEGLNSIYDNGALQFDNNHPTAVTKAQNNWWGTPAPPAGEFDGTDFSLPLSSDPQ